MKAKRPNQQPVVVDAVESDPRLEQLRAIAVNGDDDNAECATADLAREFPDRT